MNIDNSNFQFPIFNNMLSFSYTPQFNFANNYSNFVTHPILGFNFQQFNFQNLVTGFSNFNTVPQINYTSSTISTPTSLTSLEDFQKKCSDIISTSTNYSPSIAATQSTNYSLTNYIQTPPIFSTTTLKTEPEKRVVATAKKISGVDYGKLSKSEALQKASADSNLENLTSGGKNWSISRGSFINDIPYASKGTGKVLDKVASMTGQKLVITSALGTKTSPHAKGLACSHYDSSNPKLDIRVPAGMSDKQFADKLRSTGYFSHIYAEGDHIDVQIAESAYKKFDSIA